MNLDDVVVTREHKSIDLLIEIPGEKVIVVIELKIDASEHSGQLGRYRQTVQAEYPAKDGWRQLFLFLTKRGDTPSDEDGEGWQTMPLESVADAFHRVAERGVGQSDARMMLVAYVAMLRRRHLSDQRMEELARKLWSEHGEALEFLMSRRPDTLSEMFQIISDQRQSVAQRLSECIGGTVVSDHSTKFEIRFAFPKWDETPGMLLGSGWPPSKRILLLIVLRGAKNNVRIGYYLGPGPQETRQAMFDALKSSNVQIDGSWGIQKAWRQLSCKYVPAPSDDEPAEVYARKVVSELESFVADTYRAYSEAFRTMGQGEN